MNKVMSIKIRYSQINFILYGILFALTPLIFSVNTNELFEFPKTFFLYFMGATIIFLFLMHWILQPFPLKTPNNLVLLFLLSNIISTVFSMHMYTSIWGYYSRFNGGLVSFIIYFGLYFVAINTFKLKDFENIFKISLLTLIPVSLYSIIQHYGILFYSEPITRVYSTFGQPNWVAAYTAILLTFVLLCFFRENNFTLEVLFGGLYILSFMSLWFTYSMSGFLGFALSFFLIIYFFKEKFSYMAIKLLFIAAVSFLIAFLNPGIFENRLDDFFTDFKRFTLSNTLVYAQSVQPNYDPTVYKASDAGFIRRGMWKGTVNLIFTNFFLSPKIFLVGIGPETFPYAFQKFRPTELNYSSEWNYILNKPHNYYLQIFSELGIFGLTSYLTLMYFSIFRKPTFVFPAFAAFYVTNIFGWPTVATALLFWVFLAYIECTI